MSGRHGVGRKAGVGQWVATAHLGLGDLPFDHPFGDDLYMDVNLDQPYLAYSRQLGTAHSDVKRLYAMKRGGG